MESTISENQKNLGALIHISTFSKYFFPFANFFAPLLLWTLNKEKNFVDNHGKQAINFQLSILVYTLLIGLLCIPFFLMFVTDFVSLIETLEHTSHTLTFNEVSNLTGFVTLFCIAALLLFGLFVLELYAVISAAVKASKGEMYKYPICIPFLKTTNPVSPETKLQEK
jgi:uncharacterized Tic20 family protein